MILVIGEILFDIFPEYRRIGGAPLNVAYHLGKCGEPVKLLSRVGRDAEGFEALTTLRHLNIDVSGVQIDESLATGRALIELHGDGIPSFAIPVPVAFDELKLPVDSMIADRESLRLIYLGTLIQRTENGRATIRQLLEWKSPATVCLVDLNLRPGCYVVESVVASLEYANILKINEEELVALQELTGSSCSEDELVRELQHKFSISWIAVTRGERGSTLFTEKHRFEQSSMSIAISDTVGAGDGFTAVLGLGYLHGLAPEIILEKAAWFAAQICRNEGALPKSDAVYVQIMDDLRIDRRSSIERS